MIPETPIHGWHENMLQVQEELASICRSFGSTTPQFSERVKYHWLTTKDDSGIKIYFPKRRVDYADYLPGKYYFSPYEAVVILLF